MTEQERRFVRLSDKITEALKVALDQNDRRIAEVLKEALDMALTRRPAGQKEFVERREYPEELENCMAILENMTADDGEY